jgi:hypothetical protein
MRRRELSDSTERAGAKAKIFACDMIFRHVAIFGGDRNPEVPANRPESATHPLVFSGILLAP